MGQRFESRVYDGHSASQLSQTKYKNSRAEKDRVLPTLPVIASGVSGGGGPPPHVPAVVTVTNNLYIPSPKDLSRLLYMSLESSRS